MPVKIVSPWIPFRIVKRPRDGYQFAKRATWDTLREIRIVAGEKDTFSFHYAIENPVYGGTYSLEIASDIDGTRITDPQLLEVVQIPEGSTYPVVHVDASNIIVSNRYLSIYFRLIHIPPNENSGFHPSLWTPLTIVSQEEA